MSARQPEEARPLPWTGPEERPCYVIGDGSGPVSRAADRIDAIRLGTARELVAHAGEMLADHRVTPGELRCLTSLLMESLRDVGRIAEARGAVARTARGAAERGEGAPERYVPGGGGAGGGGAFGAGGAGGGAAGGGGSGGGGAGGGGGSGGGAACVGPPWAVPPGIEAAGRGSRRNPPAVT